MKDIQKSTIWYENNLGLEKIDGWEDGAGLGFFDPDGNPFSVVNEDESSPFHSNRIKELQAARQ